MISTIITAAFAIAAGPTTVAGADLTAAKAWVSLVDAKHWDQSWSAAGTLFKSQMPQARWALTIQPVRDPLGTVSSRSVKSVTKATSLPGAPDGEYEVVEFQTSFAQKIDATETIVLAHEPSGWKVDGYFIR
jgi:Protein of unknown function (DUF4019)